MASVVFSLLPWGPLPGPPSYDLTRRHSEEFRPDDLESLARREMRGLLSNPPTTLTFITARSFPFGVTANPGSGPSIRGSPRGKPSCRFGLIRSLLLDAVKQPSGMRLLNDRLNFQRTCYAALRLRPNKNGKGEKMIFSRI